MSGDEERFVELDYLIYAPAPYKGYSIRAKTQGVLESEFLAAHNDILCPFDELLFTNRQVEARVITQTSTSGPIYLSIIYKGQRLDDLGRDGIVSTIVSIPGRLLNRASGFAMKDVEAALVESQKDKARVPIGQIPKLKIVLQTRETDPDAVAMGFFIPSRCSKAIVVDSIGERSI